MGMIFRELFDDFYNISTRISMLKYVELDKSWHRETPVIATESRIYYICKGEADLTCNGKRYKLTPGNIYFVPAGAAYSYGCESYMEKLFIHVSMLQSNGYDLFNRVKDCVVLTDREAEIQRLCQQVEAADVHSMLYLKAHLHTLMLEVVERSGIDLGKPEVYTQLTYRAIRYIEEHLRCGLTIKQVAEGLQVPQSRLMKTFHKDIKVTVGKYITDRLMYAAEARLRTGEENIRDVSERFGFCDQFYFSRRFAEYFGVAPYQYRKQAMMGVPSEKV